jgi:hypothetical protein
MITKLKDFFKHKKNNQSQDKTYDFFDLENWDEVDDIILEIYDFYISNDNFLSKDELYYKSNNVLIEYQKNFYLIGQLKYLKNGNFMFYDSIKDFKEYIGIIKRKVTEIEKKHIIDILNKSVHFSSKRFNKDHTSYSLIQKKLKNL